MEVPDIVMACIIVCIPPYSGHCLGTPFARRSRRLSEKPATDEEDTRYRSVVDNVIDIITIDETGRIESFNPAASSIFGYANDEVIGHNVKC